MGVVEKNATTAWPSTITPVGGTDTRFWRLSRGVVFVVRTGSPAVTVFPATSALLFLLAWSIHVVTSASQASERHCAVSCQLRLLLRRVFFIRRSVIAPRLFTRRRTACEG